ncbi:acyl-CoA dehydrogenase family protein [Aurantimonas sp. Leaf443]|uniref:acyl-CoA dehydrogenase family protein n=1 Tax=Aurantimonas sp. Leaf443 TaxID=1736378 RepID=UPI0006F50096|nr:acyl-CoA dehydrogenase family protein [Aurantimonas sp. Leaf443]KQT87428.1 hypothetical protein ASG48_16635 [Aurantimonas sp. Leaf443]
MLDRTTSDPDVWRREIAALTGAGGDDPAPFIAVLHRHGLLERPIVGRDDGGYGYALSWHEAFETLVALGAGDLSTARLYEGHLNALQLVALYGRSGQQARVAQAVRAGVLLGVWGADAAVPVTVMAMPEGGAVFRGAKRYASGTGHVGLALVPVTAPDGVMQLHLLDVDDPGRSDVAGWDMRGMRRSASGSYRFDGIPQRVEDLIGGPDDYRREPYFVGGIWRCAAAQLGAVEAITGAIVDDLTASGRNAHPLQAARIGRAILAARTARLWVEDAAARVESGEDVDRAVALAAYARLATEEAAMTVIDLAERGVGLASFDRGHRLEAMTRDLAVYIRQANPDAVLLQHGRTLARDYAT